MILDLSHIQTAIIFALNSGWIYFSSSFASRLVAESIHEKTSSSSSTRLALPLALGALATIFWQTSSPELAACHTLFISLIGAAIQTDIETMRVLRAGTIYPLPIIFLLSYARIIPIPPTESLLGATLGYALPSVIGWIYKQVRSIDGIGGGDYDFLALIGSYLGFEAVLRTLIIGSLLGLSWNIFSYKELKNTYIPFIPFLGIGALANLVLAFLL